MLFCGELLYYLPVVRHIEFIHTDHFEKNYHRHYVSGRLSLFIDFFWETKFEKLWHQYPKGFSDALFPNLGYTYLLNLGTPFTMQVDRTRCPMKTDGFLPRLNYIECFHEPGNVLFGIKFKVSPIIFEKKVDFADYNGTIYPLSYLLDAELIKKVKAAVSFEKRIQLLMKYYDQQLDRYEGSLQPVNIVTSVLDNATKENNYTRSIEFLASSYKVSSRTLQRYFGICTGVNGKQALQVLRIRKAVNAMINDPESFHYRQFDYYDFSHFYKHLKQFVKSDSLQHLKPHLHLLQSAKKIKPVRIPARST